VSGIENFVHRTVLASALSNGAGTAPSLLPSGELQLRDFPNTTKPGWLARLSLRGTGSVNLGSTGRSRMSNLLKTALRGVTGPQGTKLYTSFHVVLHVVFT
jgi:hypothetical protein